MRVPAGKTVDSRIFDGSAAKSGIPSMILMENAAFSVFEDLQVCAAANRDAKDRAEKNKSFPK